MTRVRVCAWMKRVIRGSLFWLSCSALAVAAPTDGSIQSAGDSERYSFWWAIGSPGLRFEADNATPAIHSRRLTVSSMFTLTWPYISKADPSTIRNGGVPQAGNLSLHLDGFAAAVNNKAHGGPSQCTNMPGGYHDCVPHDFDGNCVIDFEEWNGVWEETYPRYQNKSLELVRQAHPSWDATQILAEARSTYETAAVEFLVATLRRGKELRPRCRWGYYGAPCAPAACLGAVQCNNATPPLCGFDNPSQGARFRRLSSVIQPVLEAADAAFPRIYLAPNGGDVVPPSTPAKTASWVGALVRESVRRMGTSKPVLPFMWQW